MKQDLKNWQRANSAMFVEEKVDQTIIHLENCAHVTSGTVNQYRPRLETLNGGIGQWTDNGGKQFCDKSVKYFNVNTVRIVILNHYQLVCCSGYVHNHFLFYERITGYDYTTRLAKVNNEVRGNKKDRI